MRDIKRFMQSLEGQALLKGIRDHLEKRTIRKVVFSATEEGIATTLHLDNGESFRFMEDELSVGTLFDRFGSVFYKFRADKPGTPNKKRRRNT